MNKNHYDPEGGFTKEDADAAYAELFKELHGGGSDLADIAANDIAAKKIAVFGHREPDTDSICSAIAYSRLKNEIDPLRTYCPYRAGDLNDETTFVLQYFEIPEPPLFEAAGGTFPEEEVKRNIILVDHNDPAYSVNGVSENMILEIIDHHRLSPLGTSEPVTIRIQPYGSTATIIYEIYKEKGLEPDRPTAGLLCAAVISDTRLFRSQDTTSPDRLSGAALANIAGLDIERFATEMFDILG